MFEDKTLVCKGCGREFTFTAGEQEFYKKKGFNNAPLRCKDCRNSRKASASRSNDRKGEITLYDVVCADCDQPTKVKFEPTNGKPVYCSACYQARRIR